MNDAAAVNPDGSIETERDTINRLVKNRDELVQHLQSQKEEINRLMGVNQHLEIDLSESKAITELAVKGLERISEMEFVEGDATPEMRIAIKTLAEIERLSK